MDASTHLRRSPNASFEMIDDEAVLIHLQTGAYYSLNQVGTDFLNLLDGTLSIGECADKIAADYEHPREKVLSDLLELAADLKGEGLVEEQRASAPGRAGAH